MINRQLYLGDAITPTVNGARALSDLTAGKEYLITSFDDDRNPEFLDDVGDPRYIDYSRYSYFDIVEPFAGHVSIRRFDDTYDEAITELVVVADAEGVKAIKELASRSGRGSELRRLRKIIRDAEAELLKLLGNSE